MIAPMSDVARRQSERAADRSFALSDAWLDKTLALSRCFTLWLFRWLSALPALYHVLWGPWSLQSQFLDVFWAGTFHIDIDAIPMRSRPCCTHRECEVLEEYPYRRPFSETLWNYLSETAEIGLGTICGGVTWRFMVESEAAQEYGSDHRQDVAGSGTDANLLALSPLLMLLSCLVFGCCVSSFVHRRQDKDPLQFVVYMVMLGSVVIIGRATEASANMILLGYLPWTMCLAMAISICGHSIYRQRQHGGNTSLGETEKGEYMF